MFEPTFDIEGLPELNARLDKIAALVAGPCRQAAKSSKTGRFRTFAN